MQSSWLTAGVPALLALTGTAAGLETAFSTCRKCIIGRGDDLAEAAPAARWLVGFMLVRGEWTLLSISLVHAASKCLAVLAVFAAMAANGNWLPAAAAAWLAVSVVEILGRTAFARRPEAAVAGWRWPLAVMFVLGAAPAALVRLAARFRPVNGERDEGGLLETEERIIDLVSVGDQVADVGDRQGWIIESIFEFGDRKVRDVMTPRADIKAVRAGMPMDEALGVFMESGYSRMPVFEGTLDHIRGIAMVKDLLARLAAGPIRDLTVDHVLRPAPLVPEGVGLDVVLSRMQRHHWHLAVVIDEFGATVGVVAIEDILEEIVGAIEDEYDDEAPDVIPLAPDTFVIDAGIPIHEVGSMLPQRVREEEWETLGGWLMSRLGRIPAPGEVIEIQGHQFEVLDAEEARLKTLKWTVPEDTRTPFDEDGMP